MTHLDPNLAQKIVHEVKFQGVFDEFRKDSIADVDTKPAYLNLRQRVENAVKKFLSEQRWTPDTNKYQLRDKLRRHITESGFLDVGVERIVDQVVNPKIGSVFQPRIEEIAYKYLGLPPPTRRELPPQMPMPQFPINGNALKIETVPNEAENLLPKDLEQVSPDSDKTAVLEDDKMDEEEDESPPFEPINECKSPIKIEKIESNDVKVGIKTEVEDKKIEREIDVKPTNDSLADSEQARPPDRTNTPIKDECPSPSQESQLSQVSSDTTNQLNQSGSDPPTNLENAATANISEEAQMPKFNENSTETEENTKNKKNSDLHFDIKKDEIKFEGTERKPNLLDGVQKGSSNDEPPVIGPAYNAVDIEAKSAFNFAKLVKVEPCQTQDRVSSVSSQDDTSSAQLCIVEKSEQDLLQTDTNSLQKALPEETAATALNNSQTKTNDEKHKSKSSSTSSSRHKKSSKSSRRSPDRDRSHRYEDKEQRDRSNKYSDRHSDSRHTSKHHHSSADKHSNSSRRDEKRSSSSRSESQSRHSSMKKDHRDRRDESKKYRSHKSHRSDKDSYKSRKPMPADDHNENKDKVRRRKSTDSNDDDKSPSAPNGTTNSTNNIKSINDSASTATTTTTTTTGNTKSTNNDSSSKHSKDHKQKSASNNLSVSEKVEINSSMVVVVNEILTDPTLGFVELETKPKINAAQSNNVFADEEGELLYFDHNETDLQQRLSLLDKAISHCNFAFKAFDKVQKDQKNCNMLVDGSKVNITKNNNNNNNAEIDQKMKATLQVECYQYAHNEHHSSTVEELTTDNVAAKRFKFEADCGMSKENEMNEKNAIKMDINAKTTAALKRVDMITKQRYTSEDLYKPRPILGQRIKRRVLDD